jgi:hypothetical protein
MTQRATLEAMKPLQNEFAIVLVMYRGGKPIALTLIQREPAAPLMHLSNDLAFPLQLANQIAPVANRRQLNVEQNLSAFVENALKRLYDVNHLGDHPLSQLRIVQERIETHESKASFIQRAKAIQQVLTQSIEELKPDGPLPVRTSIPHRGWHPYLVLYQGYIEGDNNDSIMRWLQISEGTFNRTRRTALHAVVRVIREMEQRHSLRCSTAP